MTKHLALVLILTGLTLLSNYAIGATLRVGTIDAAAGDAGVIVPVTLTSGSGERVVGLQFTVTMDAQSLTLTDINDGSAADAAGKDASFALIPDAPTTVFVVGLNTNVIPDGSVADLIVDVDASADDGLQPISLSNAILVDVYTEKVPSTSYDGGITVVSESEGEGAAEGEGEQEGQAELEGEGEGATEGQAELEGEGEGATEGQAELEGEGEGATEGQAELEGEGEGATEGQAELEGEGEGATEGQAELEGEGEGATEGQAELEGEGEGATEEQAELEGEGEGDSDSPPSGCLGTPHSTHMAFSADAITLVVAFGVLYRSRRHSKYSH